MERKLNVEETKVMRISRQPTIPSAEYDRPKTIGECGTLQAFG